MKLSRKILLSLVLMVAVSFVLTFSISLYFLHSRVVDEVKAGMYDELVLLESADLDKEVEFGRMRFTLIDSSGSVLYDSQAEGEMENHLARPEVQNALKNGYGEDLRHSDTLTIDMLYVALRTDEGNVIRLALPVNNIYADVANLAIPLTLLFVILFLVALFGSYRITKWIMRPIDTLDIEGNVETTPYEELLPLTERLKKQNSEIVNQLKSIKEREEEIRLIIKEMKDGIILMREDGTVLMLNNGAKAIFNLEGKDDPKSILELSRSPLFFSIIDNKGEGQGKLPVGERIIDVRANKADGLGSVMFLFDVSEKVRMEKREREFTENISHEIRTPLTSISGYSELLESGNVDEENVRKFSHLIHKEALRLKRLSDDILLLSALDGKVQIDLSENVDMGSLSDSVVEYFEGKADVKVEKDAPLTVKGNSSLLSEALMNLIGNSIKYNRDGNPIKVIVSSDRVTVKDEGIGISENDKERVFQRFYRVDKSRSRETGGTGLGLSIVKEIAQLHDANVVLDSVLGVGTSISIVFPRSSIA